MVGIRHHDNGWVSWCSSTEDVFSVVKTVSLLLTDHLRGIRSTDAFVDIQLKHLKCTSLVLHQFIFSQLNCRYYFNLWNRAPAKFY